jgi:hypothetical protein
MLSFEHLERHPEDLAVFFGESMISFSSPLRQQPGLGTLLGGGHGSLHATILKANSKLEGILYDQPSVIAGAKNDLHMTQRASPTAARSNPEISSHQCRRGMPIS